MGYATSNSCRRFRHIQSCTRSIPIRFCRIVEAPAFDPSLTFLENMSRAIPELERFCVRFRRDGVDGFALEIPDPRYGESLSSLSVAILLILSELDRLDSKSMHSIHEKPHRPERSVVFAGEPLTITAFARCLAPDDPGDTFGLHSTFLLFRPTSERLPGMGAMGVSRSRTGPPAIPIFGPNSSWGPVGSIPGVAPEAA